MVNLRKIGAIATGALFIGATLGMAVAVTVPTTFQSSMLAQNGVAKAKLVIGDKAGGIAADRASANIIADAVADKLAVSGGTGGQIEVKYGQQDLNDVDGVTSKDYFDLDGDGEGDNNTIDLDGTGIQDSRYYAVEGALKYDANADGDLKDSGDYNLYSGIYTVNGADGAIRFTYAVGGSDMINVESSYKDADDELEKGEVFKVKGTKYALTDIEWDSGEVDIGPAKALKFGAVTVAGNVDADHARIVTGDWKILYNTPDTNIDTINFYEGGSLVDTYIIDANAATPIKLNEKVAVGTLEDSYNIYLITHPAASAAMSFVDKDATVELVNDQENALGYAKVLINDDDFDNTAGAKITKAIAFQDTVVTLVRDDTIDLADTDFQLKWSISKELDIKRAKDKTQASGAKWKSSKYKDFLQGTDGTDIYISVTGGGSATPSVPVVTDDAVTSADKSGYNLVLVGGPVANSLTADLGSTKADDAGDLAFWQASDGDIKVVSSAFTSGKYGIVVAGKNREATKTAAEALAAAL
ncbi:MAG: S-layer protein [Candidatus Hydrothermarchaeales archaeon]